MADEKTTTPEEDAYFAKMKKAIVKALEGVIDQNWASTLSISA